MNHEEQTYNPNNTAREEMQDFEIYADEVEAGRHDSKIIIEDKGDFPPYLQHPDGFEAGEEVALASIEANESKPITDPVNIGVLAKAALVGTVSATAIGLLAGGAEAPSAEKAPDPIAAHTDVVEIPAQLSNSGESMTVEIADKKYESAPPSDK